MTDLKFTSPNGETTIKVEDTGRLGTVAPKTQLYIKMDEPVKYETPMTVIEDIEAQIKVLQSKLEFYKELERTKTPCEEAYKRVYGFYPETYEDSWSSFQDGYIASQKDYKVGEYQETAQERGERVHNEMEETIKIHDGYGVVDYQPTPQTPEQVADGLKEAFREAVKQGVVSSADKPKKNRDSFDKVMDEMIAESKLKQKSLYDVIDDWWSDVFTNNWDDRNCINTLVDRIELFLPKEQSAAGSQNAYVESAVEGFNDCLNTIKRKLR